MAMNEIVNIQTGKHPTAKEWELIKQRAIEIFQSPYSSPEQIEWAIEIYPEGFAEAFSFRPLQEERQNQIVRKS
jgi:hypothetical protein